VIKAEFKKKISQESQGQQITWEDIIGYADVKNEIKTTFVSSRRHNFSTAAFNIPALRYMALFGVSFYALLGAFLSSIDININ